ncbi:MAG: deoxyribonuclease V [Gammaproteobacteria bacterium]|nr:deoxyribonuclease V [Gammaproteobacteria bacterium]
MQLHHQHPWDVSPQQAKEIQNDLKTKVILYDQLPDIHYVAGIDVGFENKNTITRAAIAVLKFPELELQESVIARSPTQFPYIPGYLSFREVPTILQAFEQLKQLPDVLLCDGQGIAHPRRFGIACHLGVLTDLPAIGVAKSRLIGEYAKIPVNKGDYVELIDGDEVIGAVLCTRNNVKPLYISSGHKITLSSAIKLVMQCVIKYRLPETTRWAHRLASQVA